MCLRGRVGAPGFSAAGLVPLPCAGVSYKPGRVRLESIDSQEHHLGGHQNLGQSTQVYTLSFLFVV